MSVAAPVRILTVCTHNRTRSVMMAALLESMLNDRVGSAGVVLRSSGFRRPGLPPIDDAVEAMRRRGLDVSHHRSSVTTAEAVESADLIVTAERDHVVRIATLSRSAFPRAMTLPEALIRTGSRPRIDAPDVRSWSEQLTEGRTAGAYLRDDVAEVDDPTGSAPRAFEQAVVGIERQCRELASLLVHHTRH